MSRDRFKTWQRILEVAVVLAIAGIVLAMGDTSKLCSQPKENQTFNATEYQQSVERNNDINMRW